MYYSLLEKFNCNSTTIVDHKLSPWHMMESTMTFSLRLNWPQLNFSRTWSTSFISKSLSTPSILSVVCASKWCDEWHPKKLFYLYGIYNVFSYRCRTYNYKYETYLYMRVASYMSDASNTFSYIKEWKFHWNFNVFSFKQNS